MRDTAIGIIGRCPHDSPRWGWPVLTRAEIAGHRVVMHRRRREARGRPRHTSVFAGGRSRCRSRGRRSSRRRGRRRGRHRPMFSTLLRAERNRRKHGCDQGSNRGPRTRGQSLQAHRSPHDEPAERVRAGAVGVTPTPAVTESVLRLALRRLQPAATCTGPSVPFVNGVAAVSEP